LFHFNGFTLYLRVLPNLLTLPTPDPMSTQREGSTSPGAQSQTTTFGGSYEVPAAA
jgi:hypothetical protein